MMIQVGRLHKQRALMSMLGKTTKLEQVSNGTATYGKLHGCTGDIQRVDLWGAGESISVNGRQVIVKQKSRSECK